MTVLLLGYIIRGPWGGMVWHHFQYLQGLHAMGHELYFLEDSDDYPSCYTPWSAQASTDFSYGVSFLQSVFTKFGLEQRWAYYDAHTNSWHGPVSERIKPIIKSADLLLNLSGVNPLREWFQGVPVRVLVDTDPVFTQVRHLKKRDSLRDALRHNRFFTFGANIGKPGCKIPDDGLPWRPTRQPVALDLWPVTAGDPKGKFTTVMQWRSYPAIEYEGTLYGMKSDSFQAFLDLPNRATAVFELAAKGLGADEEMLKRRGWQIVDAETVTLDPWQYQKYLQQSSAEFSVAKHGYVVSRSGWFSERSAAYLSMGRPVLVQDTGFTDWLPSGIGVMPFRSADEAVAGVEAIQGNYRRHCEAARAIAQEYFDARKVLSAMLDEAMSGAPVEESAKTRAG
jgi:hypothetical protein